MAKTRSKNCPWFSWDINGASPYKVKRIDQAGHAGKKYDNNAGNCRINLSAGKNPRQEENRYPVGKSVDINIIIPKHCIMRIEQRSKRKKRITMGISRKS